MKIRSLLILFLLVTLQVLVAQKSKKTTAPEIREGVSQLARYNLSESSPRQFILPKKVSEASGLTMTDDGRLFVHDDERAVVYQIDYSSGVIVKQFALGRFGVKGDFEDIAVKGRTFYLVRSDGVLFEFPEGGDGQTVDFRTYKTQLSAKNDV